MSLASTAPGLLSQTAGYKRAAEIFGEAGTVGAYLRFEAALAEAEGGIGVIPCEAVAPILAVCRRERIDFDLLRTGSAMVGYPIVPLVSMLAELVGEHGRWVHYGATTQDVMDTAQVLQLRAALAGVLADLPRVERPLADLCDTYRRTPMAGRSKLQHGVPVPFGYKAAVWLDQIMRARAGLTRALDEASMVQFGGAVGTLASLRGTGMEVRRRLAKGLALAEPSISWHVSRDRMTALSASIATLLAALAKMAGDIAHLMSTEIGELREPAAKGRGSSSTMPQKRNPVICEAILEAARDVRHAPTVLLEAMLQEQERGIGHGYRERRVLCDAVQHLAGAVSLADELLAGLEVNEARMRSNLEMTKGLIHSEAVMIHLSDSFGRIKAHHLLHEISHRVGETGIDLGAAIEDATGMPLPRYVLDARIQIEAPQDMIDMVLEDFSREIENAGRVETIRQREIPT
ncbi:MAG: adenylosuccinate lyase family protein [Rhodospirillum sp.]|nr:adenylosuccinate lyase family protein [Rhodospirillum sp.]MCF8489082.1 adenylosuccinate lyase family protein [Rhodospirillum sp.]